LIWYKFIIVLSFIRLFKNSVFIFFTTLFCIRITFIILKYLFHLIWNLHNILIKPLLEKLLFNDINMSHSLKYWLTPTLIRLISIYDLQNFWIINVASFCFFSTSLKTFLKWICLINFCIRWINELLSHLIFSFLIHFSYHILLDSSLRILNDKSIFLILHVSLIWTKFF